MGLRFPPSGFTDRTAARAGVRYASWLRRLGGFVIDFLLVLMIRYLVVNVILFVIKPFPDRFYAWLFLVGSLSFISLVYATLCLAKLNGQTPGMKALEIRCVPITQRGRLTMPQSLTRALTFTVVISAPVVFARPVVLLALLPVVACLWTLVDQRRQTWWDHLAATIVLDEHGY